MSLRISRFFSTVALCLSATNVAWADGGYMALGYADAAGRSGAEVELGWWKSWDRTNLNISPLSGIFYKADSRYREESFSNGQTVCRDKSNGRFADDEKCDSRLDYAFLASLDYGVNDGIRGGIGIRLARKSSVYVTARARITPSLELVARGGNQYAAANFTLSF